MEQHLRNPSPKNLRNRIILTLSFLIAIMGYSCWEYLQQFLEEYYTKDVAEEKAVTFFFACIEIAFAGYTYLIKELLINEKDKYLKQISEFVFFTTLAAVYDRIFGNPFVISTYEYIIFFLSFIITFRWKIQDLTNWNERWTALKQKLKGLRQKLKQVIRT